MNTTNDSTQNLVKQDANTRNVHNETREGWYCFETLVAGQRKYLGKALTTHEAIKYAMPWSDIVGNLVTIYAKPPQHAKRFAHIRRNASRVSTAAT